MLYGAPHHRGFKFQIVALSLWAMSLVQLLFVVVVVIGGKAGRVWSWSLTSI